MSDIHTCHDHCQRPLCVMRRENEALKKDRERLEWLVENAATVDKTTAGIYYLWCDAGELSVDILRKDWRDAIDQAMEGEQRR